MAIGSLGKCLFINSAIFLLFMRRGFRGGVLCPFILCTPFGLTSLTSRRSSTAAKSATFPSSAGRMTDLSLFLQLTREVGHTDIYGNWGFLLKGKKTFKSHKNTWKVLTLLLMGCFSLEIWWGGGGGGGGYSIHPLFTYKNGLDHTLRHPWKCLVLAVKIILSKAG